MKSIVCNQNIKQCYVCGAKYNLHLHHIMFGKNRKKADEDGLTVWLCYQHHEGTNGVHGKNGHDLDTRLKEIAEDIWIKHNDKEIKDFITRYGKNYL